MESQVLSVDKKKIYCKVSKSVIESEYLLSVQCKCFMDIIENFSSYTLLELTCSLPLDENSGIKVSFNPNQRNTIVANTAFLKDSTRFTWYFHSNQRMEVENFLNLIELSYRCLEN